ncbi:hypothetical protein SARC_14397 [Sphaeroforma arctica JP610]|uniref:TLC domain-containing protein n=1 Tax=Sphaeroforma arctica JP610 TaxID=667725 RepID=A0A0L0F8K1_9EUKA|nr:hypothetical protein SARC_14397 [Sphaeroforma arctica JP610]KNC73042.1 hypothetical protein SARC_14397 [Sphaeroforma arctica JP610]|eukprot:XP_014146944.1 hypothetical protein SARC_14397 [Sphaeroforma arctica JP610]
MNEREIQRWLRRKKNSLIATPTKKFSECLFKVLYYSSVFLYGVIVLYNRPWAWDLHQAYHNLPMHPIDGHITNYYIIQLAYYTACLVTLPVDNRRKDFVELVIHHIATVLLIAFSWYTNLWKVGTLVMVIHDAADVFLEIAKTFNYAGYQEIANHGFTVFAISFFFTRLVLFPIVIKSVIEKPVEIIFYEESLYDYVTKGHVVVSHVTFSVLLCILLALHVFWFSIIAKMAMSMITEPVSKDVRSDDEYGFSTDEEQENARKQAITNAQERKENKKEE